jgi:hypothetical protein
MNLLTQQATEWWLRKTIKAKQLFVKALNQSISASIPGRG